MKKVGSEVNLCKRFFFFFDSLLEILCALSGF
jgi:hypothetical protein